MSKPHKISLEQLLQLLAINGNDVNATVRAAIICDIIDDTYPRYKDIYLKPTPKKLIAEAKVKWSRKDLEVTYTMGCYHVYYHVNEDIYTPLHFFHAIRGYKNHT